VAAEENEWQGSENRGRRWRNRASRGRAGGGQEVADDVGGEVRGCEESAD